MIRYLTFKKGSAMSPSLSEFVSGLRRLFRHVPVRSSGEPTSTILVSCLRLMDHPHSSVRLAFRSRSRPASRRRLLSSVQFHVFVLVDILLSCVDDIVTARVDVLSAIVDMLTPC